MVNKLFGKTLRHHQLRYCRPIKFVFAKETPTIIVSEVDKIKEQARSLIPTEIIVNDMEVLVKPTLIFCMIDGKICNAVSSCTATQTCYIKYVVPNPVK